MYNNASHHDATLALWLSVKQHILQQQPQACKSVMELQYYALALEAVELLISKYTETRQTRVVITIGGTPGSGKSTLAARVMGILNRAHTAARSAQAQHNTMSLYSLSNLSNATIESSSSEFSLMSDDDTTVSSVSSVSSAHAGDMDMSSPVQAADVTADGPQRGSTFCTVQVPTSADSLTTMAAAACTCVATKTKPCTSTLKTAFHIPHHHPHEQNIYEFYNNKNQDAATTTQEAQSAAHAPHFLVEPASAAFCPNHDDNSQILGWQKQQATHDLPVSAHPADAHSPASDFNLNNNDDEDDDNIDEFATTVSMDGYHLTRAQLDCFPDPVEAHARRGAHWTFDAQGVVAMAESLHQSTLTTSAAERSELSFPSFDHAVKDPTPGGVIVPASTQIVFLEGLYTLLAVSPWRQIAPLADMTWSIRVPLSLTRLRLARRHLAAGIVGSLEEGYARVDLNDAVNAVYISEHCVKADRYIESVQEN